MKRLGSPALLLGGTLALLLLIYWGGIHRDIVGPGESRVAQLAWEMQAYGNWLLPSYHGQVSHVTLTKPPLYHWLVAATATPFHWQNFSLRLVSLFSTFACIWLVWRLGRRLFGDQAGGLWAALVLASAPVFVAYGLSARMDLFLTLLVLVAMGLLQQVLETPERRGALAAFFVVIGLAMLVKGPAGLIIPVATALLMALTSGGRLRVRQLLPGWGVALFLAMGLSWYLAVLFLAPPEAVKSLFITEPLNWAEGNAGGIQTRFWYYLPLLLAGLFPWSLFLAAALVEALRGENRRRRPVRFLLFWFLGGLILFSLGGKKAIRYLLPILPAAALLVGWYFQQLQARGRAGGGALAAGAAITLITVALVAALLLGLTNPEAAGARLLTGRNPTDRVVLGIFWETLAGHRLTTALVALLMLGLALHALVQLHRPRIQAAILAYAAISWLLLAAYFHALLPVQSRLLSPREVAQFIHDQVGDGPLYGGGRAFQRAMHWYLRRSFTELPKREIRRVAAEDPSAAVFIMHRKPLPAELLAARPHCQWRNPKLTITFFPAVNRTGAVECMLRRRS